MRKVAEYVLMLSGLLGLLTTISAVLGVAIIGIRACVQSPSIILNAVGWLVIGFLTCVALCLFERR